MFTDLSKRLDESSEIGSTFIQSYCYESRIFLRIDLNAMFISRFAQLLEDQLKLQQIFTRFLVATRLVCRGSNTVYYEGTAEQFEAYLKLNGGAFRLLHSFKIQSFNIDLNTPLIWKLK